MVPKPLHVIMLIGSDLPCQKWNDAIGFQDLINGRGTTANPIRGQHQKANSSLNIVALL